MSFGRNVGVGVATLVVAAAVGAGGLFYAEHRAVTQLDDALKSLPSGLEASYATARYSLMSGKWNIEGFLLRQGDDEPRMMKIADLTIIDLDRETLKAVLDPQARNTGRALARSISLSGLTIHDPVSSFGARTSFSLSHAAVPFPYFRSPLSEETLFSPREWLERLQAPDVLALGIRWHENGTRGQIDRLSLDRLTQMTRTKATDGAFVWAAADESPGEAAVGGAVISGISLSWRKGGGAQARYRNEKGSGSFRIKEIDVKEGMLRPLLAFRFSQGEERGMSVPGEWLRGVDGQEVTVTDLHVVLTGDGSEGERVVSIDQAPWRDRLSIGRLQAERADGNGHVARLVLNDAGFVHDDVVAFPVLSHFDGEEHDPVLRRVGIGRFEGRNIVFGENISDASFEKANLENADFSYGDRWDGGVRGSVASLEVQNVVNRDGRPVAADISTRMLKLVFPTADDRQGDGGWAEWLVSPSVSADMDLSYALDEQNAMLEIGRFDLAVTPVGHLVMTMKLALGAEKGDSFADDDIAADFLRRFMPSEWSSWIAKNVRLSRVDLRYNDDSLLEKHSALLRLPQDDEDDVRAWNGFVDDPKAKTLHLTLSPDQPVSMATLIAMLSYYPFDVLKDALGMTLDLSSQGGQRP